MMARHQCLNFRQRVATEQLFFCRNVHVARHQQIVSAAGAAHSLVWLDLADAERVDEAALLKLGARMVLRDGQGLQLLIDGAEDLATALA